MLPSRCIHKGAHELAAIVEANNLRADRTGDIDLRECAFNFRQAMCPPGRIYKEANDLARVIDGLQLGGGGAGKIELAEYTVFENQPVLNSGSVREGPDNVGAIVQP